MERALPAGIGTKLAIGKRDHAFRLLRYFSITAGIAILLVTFMCSWAYYRKEINDQIEATEGRNVVLAQTVANAIWPQADNSLRRKSGNAGKAGDSIDPQELQETLKSMVRHVPVAKIKIYNPSGSTIYSSEGGEISAEKSNNRAFHVARTGKPVSELTRRGQASDSEEDEVETADVVSTYIPILGDKGEVQAVFELYADVTETLARLQQTTLQLVFGLVSIFAALYAVLLLIVGAADNILRRQYKELKVSQEQIHAKNLALQSEIEARRVVEAALRTSEEFAATANRAKTEFLSNMSHELRTPMNAILGFGQLLLSEPTAPLGANQRSFVEQILKAGRHLLALINEVLDLARIEAGKIILSVEPVSIANVIGECLPLIQNMARDMNVRIESPPASIEVSVMADNMRLKQVMLNLLSNAVKYNRSGGNVSVGVANRGPGRARISVKDTGPGIPVSLQGDLFRPFQRLVPESSVVEGTGIGLALTRNLVIAMGGEVGFESVAGTGTTFWIELPLAPDSPTAAVAASRIEPTTESDRHAQHSVLYIEDNPANVMLMEEIAKRMSLRFMTAHNGELGIALAAAEQPDLVIMDINLPQMNGFEALAQLKQNPATVSIPVIALSANAMEKDVECGLAAGFLRYHTKPIDVDEMAKSIGQMLGERE